MRLTVLEDSNGKIIAWSPDQTAKDPADTSTGQPGHASYTGIAPLPGQRIFSVEVPDEVAIRLQKDESTDEVEILRSYPRTEVVTPTPPTLPRG